MGLIRAEGVTKVLNEGANEVTLVRDIDLDIDKGEFVAITGPSGSGKSSLLYLLGLLDLPTAGRILLDGQDTSPLDSAELAALRLAKLGFVFQFHFLLPEFTTFENVMLPMRRLGALDEPSMEARTRELLERLDLSKEGAKRPGQLSGGQRQRVAIARALANEPLVILADEPTGNLDTRNAQNVFAIFRRMVEEGGRTVIAVTHDTDLAALARRRVHIVDGRIARP
ncbi:MAG: ABC transporter ATP-binding protein [Alphaproteobacteria bacterium]|nr:ABC transporter ATP-binding protein [Alphaproteobacteria bacterium]